MMIMMIIIDTPVLDNYMMTRMMIRVMMIHTTVLNNYMMIMMMMTIDTSVHDD